MRKRKLILFSVAALGNNTYSSEYFSLLKKYLPYSKEIKFKAPLLTCPIHASITTGQLPSNHGIVSNGYYIKEWEKVLFWLMPDNMIPQERIWSILKTHQIKTGIFFLQNIKGCKADIYIYPAPKHLEDGSTIMWCNTSPNFLYEELRTKFDDFDLKYYWGPMACIKSTEWILNSFVYTFNKFLPDFSIVYIPHLDYNSQRYGPYAPQTIEDYKKIDLLLSQTIEKIKNIYEEAEYILLGEYPIFSVNNYLAPNLILKQEKLLEISNERNMDYTKSIAFAVCDHQVAHIYTKQPQKVVEIFKHFSEISEIIYTSSQKTHYGLNHPNAGDVILFSKENSWFHYAWWEDLSEAPEYAGKVDIHNKPGYDPLALFIDKNTGTIPQTPQLIRGSHGLPGKSFISGSLPIIENINFYTDIFKTIISFFNES